MYALASRIRAALHRVGLGHALLRSPSTSAYRLDVDPGLVDFHRFRRLVSAGRAAAERRDFTAASQLLGDAVALWQDEPLADLRTAPAEHLRETMGNTLLEARKLLATNRLRLGQHHRALVELEPLMGADDVDETLAQLWMDALCAAGRDHEARKYFHAFRRRFRRLMRAEPAVALPPATPGAGERATVVVHSLPPASTAAPRQLPKDVSDFTGREPLLAAIDTLVQPDGTGVVALSGMPGVGKTSLAVHWAHRHRHRFPDGQLFLDANAYGPTAPVDPEDALGRFLEALDVPADRMPAGLDRRRNRFNQLLAGRRLLVVLDNVRDSRQVRPLIPSAAECLTVITSRNRLRGLTVREGVPSITVPPLPDTDAFALLRRTVGAERADAEPGPVGALARLSCGHPLALRIIGEHVAERPRAAIADLVDELTARLLDADGEDDEEASLRTMFAWSYQALVPEAARLFRMLGLYPGTSIGPEASAALLGTGVAPAEALLDILARMCLINHDTARRYRLHDLLRRFAADRAGEDDPQVRTDALRRLLDWSLLSGVNAVAVLAPDRQPVPDLPKATTVRPQTFTGDTDAMAWCEVERENLAAVGLWAGRHGFDRHAWQLPEILVEPFQRRGHQEEMLPLLKSALAAAERDGHHVAQVGTLNNIGTAYFALHDHANAAASIEQALRLARRIGFAEAEAACLHNLATVHLSDGDAALAARIHRDVVAVCRATGNPMGEASALHRLGDALRQLGEHHEAAAHYRAALGLRERTGSLRGQGAIHRALAMLYLDLDRPDRALGHGERALDIHGGTRDDPGLCDALITMADIHRRLARPDEALRDAEQATALSLDLADTRRRCHALAVLTDALTASGDEALAACRRAEALALIEEIDDPQMRPTRDRLLAARHPAGVGRGEGAASTSESPAPSGLAVADVVPLGGKVSCD
ncbi:ATP-binding protein [Dactylosporangium sp. CA-233914]|uniref:ATP-binding protein n=1 Tax=Dactylosporangium sp. CA-233914 TaxID=3239934 RepID=UPI003D91FE4F